MIIKFCKKLIIIKRKTYKKLKKDNEKYKEEIENLQKRIEEYRNPCLAQGHN